MIRLYRAWFQAYPNTASMSAWLQRRQAGMTPSTISAFFGAYPTPKARYGHLSNAQFVTQVYVDLLGYRPAAANAALWKKRLDGGLPRSEMMLTFAQSDGFRARVAPRAWIHGTWFAMVKRMASDAELNAALPRTQTQVVAGLRSSVSYAATH